MERLRRFILESAFSEDFSKAVYNALGIFEAVNINKMFLIQAAGGPDELRAVKERVNGAWADAHMDGVVRGGNLIQKLFNFLYLMEIRQPGFVNNELLSKIHDVAIHGSLDQKFLSKVDSDTRPEAALAILDDAKNSAVQAAKPYPSLSAAEEKIWNRVRVYHEFPDGFKWVYAIDANGKVTSYIPSRITSQTMNHCGNEPSKKAGDEYWELRDSQGKAYLTIILNSAGQIEESKSWGNQTSKYRQQILPYVKWLLKDKKVTGVGYRYDNGYATHMNFGVKDFIGDDPEFIDYVLENKEALLGNAESRILFWQTALKEGYVTVDDLKKAYASGMSRSDFFEKIPALNEYAKTARFQIREGQRDEYNSLFGLNSFAVLCAACSGNPFTEKELIDMIRKRKLKLEVFANYSIKLLTPAIQEAFVKTDAHNMDTLIQISNQVASFHIADELWRAMMPTEEEISQLGGGNDGAIIERCYSVLRMINEANPPSKMADTAKEVLSNKSFLRYVYTYITMPEDEGDRIFGYKLQHIGPITTIYEMLANIIGKFSDLPLPDGYEQMHRTALESYLAQPSSGAQDNRDDYDEQEYRRNWVSLIKGDNNIGRPRNETLLSHYTDTMITNMLRSNGVSSKYDHIKENLEILCNMFSCDRITELGRGMKGGRNAATLAAMATTMPKTDELAEFARRVVYEYFYKKQRGEGSGYQWEDDDPYTHEPIHIIVFDLLIHWDAMLRILKWDDDRTYRAMQCMICKFHRDSLKVPKSELERVLNYFIGEMSSHPEFARQAWQDATSYRSFPRALHDVIVSYGIESDVIRAFFREMAECDMRDAGESRLVGPWSIFTIPYEEWEGEYSSYGFLFVNGYVLQAPTDTMYENEFIPNFICDKLLDKNWSGIEELIQRISGADSARKKRCLAQRISARIVNDEFPLNGEEGEQLFNILYDGRLINAAAYRSVMGRREDRGVVTVDNIATVANVAKAFTSIQKLDTLPELIEATFKYMVDTLYENMGDGRIRWKVDENAHEEAYMIGILSAKLASKATVGNVPKAIKKLYEDGLVDRIREFPAANRAACETPNKPKSKITCGAIRDLNDAVFALDRVKDTAFAAADKPAKATRRKKSAGQ